MSEVCGGTLLRLAVAGWRMALFAVVCVAWLPPANGAVSRGVRGEIAWVAGGVGLDEREEMRQVERDYNVKLVTAIDEANAFIAQVHVDIHRGDTMIFDLTIDGPWLLLRLPAGTYTLTANASGVVRRQMLVVPAEGRIERVLVWGGRELERGVR